MIELNLEEETPTKLGASLKVIGVGGAGGNAVGSMIDSSELENISFIVANTDAQALNLSAADIKVQIGEKITKGLGAGSNPDIGRRAAEENLDLILDKISDTEILFLTAGLGGGTGSGALPVIAKAAKELGILTIAVVTTPFSFEGKRRLNHAQESINNLKGNVDTLIVVPNQKLLDISDPQISMLNAFAMSNDVLLQAIKGISDIITKAGHINVDFADVKEIMHDMGMAIMGTGQATGQDRARQATVKAISSPLLEDISIKGAKGVLINITGNTDLALQEINDVASIIHEMVSDDAEIILGSVIDSNIGDEIIVTIIATGFQAQKQEQETVVSHKKEIEKDLAYKKIEPQVSQEFLDNQDVLKVTPSNISDNSFDMDDIDTPTFLRKQADSEAQVDEICASVLDKTAEKEEKEEQTTL